MTVGTPVETPKPCWQPPLEVLNRVQQSPCHTAIVVHFFKKIWSRLFIFKTSKRKYIKNDTTRASQLGVALKRTSKIISKSLLIFFLNGRNRDFSEKIPSNSLSQWSSKYNHLLFWILR
jgi:hypothetical protein